MNCECVIEFSYFLCVAANFSLTEQSTPFVSVLNSDCCLLNSWIPLAVVPQFTYLHAYYPSRSDILARTLCFRLKAHMLSSFMSISCGKDRIPVLLPFNTFDAKHSNRCVMLICCELHQINMCYFIKFQYPFVQIVPKWHHFLSPSVDVS